MLDTHKLEKARDWLEENLLTMREAADLSKLTYRAILSAADRGVIPTVREKYILKADLVLYMRRRTK